MQTFLRFPKTTIARAQEDKEDQTQGIIVQLARLAPTVKYAIKKLVIANARLALEVLLDLMMQQIVIARKIHQRKPIPIAKLVNHIRRFKKCVFPTRRLVHLVKLELELVIIAILLIALTVEIQTELAEARLRLRQLAQAIKQETLKVFAVLILAQAVVPRKLLEVVAIVVTILAQLVEVAEEVVARAN